MVSKSNLSLWLIFLIMFPVVVLLLSVTFGHAFAQEPPTSFIDRRVEIWGLFYRGMVAAFVVGALVQGSIIYVAWRFRESNKKNKPPRSVEGAHH